MEIASWILPVLWREHDWRAALERLGSQLVRVDNNAKAMRAAIELGRASEHIEPDRRRAIALYELSGPDGELKRARELATDLGWWSAVARLTLAANVADPSPRLAVQEAEAWWDAGQPDLCMLALAGSRSIRELRAIQLAALVAERDLERHATEAAERAAEEESAADSADEYVMAARLSRAAGRVEDVTRWLEAALLGQPDHRVAGSLLLALACRARDPELIKRYLRLRLEAAEGTLWLEGMRATAFALIDTDHHRGFGLRLLRQTLERAYASEASEIPGHLAMWTLLAAHASADGTRRELLPLVISALHASKQDVDRVWLAALATEISLRDAKHRVVAGAYAEIVAEHAPEHPIVRELVAAVADAPIERSAEVPPAAVTAATAATRLEIELEFDLDIDLEDAYAVAADAALVDAASSKLAAKPVAAAKPHAAPAKSAAPTAPAKLPPTAKAPTPAAPAPSPIASVLTKAPTPAATPPGAARPAQTGAATPARAASAPSPSTTPTPTAAAAATAKPSIAPAAPTATVKPSIAPASTAAPATAKPSIAPASIAKPSVATKPASIVPASLKNSILPSFPKPAPTATATATPAAPKPARAPALASLPPAARVAPVLAALRTADRPDVPPRPADPPDASPRARRIAIPIDVRLIAPDGRRIDTHSRDISTSGLFVLTDASFEVGAELMIELLLPGKEAFTEDEYSARAKIARRTDDGYGLVLVGPSPELLVALAAL